MMWPREHYRRSAETGVLKVVCRGVKKSFRVASQFLGWVKISQLSNLYNHLFVVLLLAATGCSTQRPVLYPNEHLKRVGPKLAEQDIEECLRQAGGYVRPEGRAEKAAESAITSAGTDAAIGAAGGAAGGAVVGRAGTGAAAGAAGGGASGFARGLVGGILGSREPSPTYRAFVDRCLREKGYDPLGWK